MTQVASILGKAVAALDELQRAPSTARPQFRIEVVRTAAAALAETQRIHPFLNGNGHAGRFIVLALLGRYRMTLRDWTIDDRPPYDQLIEDWISGAHLPLETFLAGKLIDSGGSSATTAPPPASPPSPSGAGSG
jgi:fido (protein-threonine AMPylation protein)